MSERDDELDALLAPLKHTKPTPFEITRWRNAIERQQKHKPMPMWLKIAAAFVVGVGVGTLGNRFNHLYNDVVAQDEFSTFDATIVQVTVNH